MKLREKKLLKVLTVLSDDERGVKFFSVVNSSIRQDIDEFLEDLFCLPWRVRRLYLPLAFDIGMVNGSFPAVFPFYAFEGSLLIEEVIFGFEYVGLDRAGKSIRDAFNYWKDPSSAVHSAAVPWMQMEKDVPGALDVYYEQTKSLSSLVGSRIKELGLVLLENGRIEPQGQMEHRGGIL